MTSNEYKKKIELKMQERENIRKKQEKRGQYKGKDVDESNYLSFSDLDYFYEEASKSVSGQSLNIERKKSKMKYEELESNKESLLEFNNESYEGLNNNTSNNKPFFDNLFSISENCIKEDKVDDIFEIFNTPVQDFVENDNSDEVSNLNYQKKELFSDCESNEHDISNDEIISQLIEMGFDYDKVIRAIDITHVKTYIDSIISVLMSLDLLDNEKRDNSSKTDIIDKGKGIFSLDNKHFLSKISDKANNIFNRGKNYLEASRNHNMQSNDYCQVPNHTFSKYQPLLSNQKSFEEIKNCDKTVTSKTSTLTIEKNNDLMDFLSDEPNYQQPSSSSELSRLFSNEIETRDYKEKNQNLTHCYINSEGILLLDHVSQDLFTEHLDLSNLPHLINQLDVNIKHASNAFNNGNYSEALGRYSESIEYLPLNHVLKILLLFNRSLCYLHMEKLELSLLDCDELLKLIENKRGLGKNIFSEKVIDDIREKIIIRRSKCLQRLKKLGKAKNWQKETIDSSIDDLMALNSKNDCEKIHKSDILLDIDFSENSKNENSISKSEKEPLEKPYDVLEIQNEDKSLLYDKVDSSVNNWADGKRDNIRALLSSLNNILWDDLAWQNINMANLLTTSQVKKAYLKTISKIHPDKLPITTFLEHRMIASSVFNILNNAWNIFKIKNNI
ncbi:hypothetical protein T552_00946 [Pneumocystis carinii B80]|uniref:UBA domain-containing protein n=1 Tax=Pneumocystis carinii (strain B80) TaxID=1408658 RepID=A0A0W4ZN03_PNEC8|nr:hypothetical protein T552_00946 [Pneumocystis carinii B80]KTW29739.1 hypothetical protein T552_00946 [Pneumocystis carinii B80]